MITVIDNYDSFVFNLARYVRELGQPVRVHRNDTVSVDEVLSTHPSGIIISPGPCGPDEAGISTKLARAAVETGVPLLGVCLGHQCVVAACGGSIGRADAPVHGRASTITHAESGLFEGLPSPMEVGRYHSLIATGEVPASLAVTAQLEDDPTVPMAVAHVSAPVFGVQFHPESVLTEHGHALIGNFLSLTAAPFAKAGQ